MAMTAPERTCAICGKEFIGRDQWVYRRGSHWFCSWSCLTAYDRRKKASAKTNSRRLKRMERREIADLLSRGIKPHTIADQLGVSVNAILYYKQKAEA